MAELLALVMGDMDLVRPVGEAGMGCVVVARPGDPTRWSRYTRAVIDPTEPRFLERMIEFGRAQDERPILYYEADWSAELVSENREALSEAYRFVIPAPDLMAKCLSKDGFLGLVEQAGLPVPRSIRAQPSEGPPPEIEFGFPLIIKPIPGRDDAWDAIAGRTRKALGVENRPELDRIWRRLAGRSAPVMLQELIPGPESRIESYHAYITANGDVAAEFTGRKIRTFPIEFGASTALETTDAADVIAAGRDFVERAEYRGVLKADFKRRSDGSLALLEVNPRFSLWHALGAKAGVNIPAAVAAELTGSPRPPASHARPGVTWCDPAADWKAARQSGISGARWLAWMLLRCDVRSAASARDPLPLIRGKVLGRLAAKTRR